MRRILLIIFDADTELLEFASATGLLAWGIWNVSPFIDPDLGINGYLAALLPLWVWSFFFILAGLFSVFTLLRGDLPLRKLAAFIKMFAWLNLSLASFAVGGAGALYFATVAMGSIWIFLRLTRFTAWVQNLLRRFSLRCL